MYHRLLLGKRVYGSIDCTVQHHIRLLLGLSIAAHFIRHGDIRDCYFVYKQLFLLCFRDHQTVIILS